ncbi:acylneuraminate cytidylyltransferase family protein [Candidatus Woesearchaeota archaeon]|nr:acylneuraminate cytidylyltransferase family protein [Candidatus Woesearchaeota archaeon]
MYGKRKIISIIPARGGSKRIKKKNIRLLKGRPLIAYSIEQSLNSKYIDRTIVSTEDPEIKASALLYKAEIIDRPKELAEDTSKSIDVLKHVLNYLNANEKYIPDIVVLLQPTSPLRKAEHIDSAIKIFADNNADTLFSVTKRHLGPQWILKKEKNQVRFLFENDFNVLRTQDEEETYEINGAIYIYTSDVIFKSGNYGYGKRVFPFPMDKISSIDIDEPIDWKIAEKLMEIK